MFNINKSVTVTATVTNIAPIGSPSWGSGATEIPQLYVTVPRQANLFVPFSALQGFTKVQLPCSRAPIFSSSSSRGSIAQ